MGRELLNLIRSSLEANQDRLTISGQLHLTKSAPAYSEAILQRDFDLEESVSSWIEERSSKDEVLSRYQSLSEEPISKNLPRHYAMRVLSGKGAICSGKNIFLFFPQCLGVEQTGEDDCFGLELIDVWRNVFDKVVFPCSRTVLDTNSLFSMIPPLLQSIEKTTYLASVFHEIGHRVGPWRVSPAKDNNINVDPHLLDILGELSTDCALVYNLKEFPEICAFVTLQRIFWFGRRGYLDNPRSAWINNDNDSWITACLWNELEKNNILIKKSSKYSIQAEKLTEFYEKLYLEIKFLGETVLRKSDPSEQNQMIYEWMKRKVEWDEKGGFFLSKSLQDVFSQCSRLPEIPQFNPVLDLHN